MVLDLLSRQHLLSGIWGGSGPARDGDGLWVFSGPGSFEARQEVGVYGGLGPL